MSRISGVTIREIRSRTGLFTSIYETLNPNVRGLHDKAIAGRITVADLHHLAVYLERHPNSFREKENIMLAREVLRPAFENSYNSQEMKEAAQVGLELLAQEGIAGNEPARSILKDSEKPLPTSPRPAISRTTPPRPEDFFTPQIPISQTALALKRQEKLNNIAADILKLKRDPIFTAHLDFPSRQALAQLESLISKAKLTEEHPTIFGFSIIEMYEAAFHVNQKGDRSKFIRSDLAELLHDSGIEPIEPPLRAAAKDFQKTAIIVGYGKIKGFTDQIIRVEAPGFKKGTWIMRPAKIIVGK